MTARLLAAAVGTPAREDEHWVTTLRACSAHEAYLRHVPARGRPAGRCWSSCCWTGCSRARCCTR